MRMGVSGMLFAGGGKSWQLHLQPRPPKTPHSTVPSRITKIVSALLLAPT